MFRGRRSALLAGAALAVLAGGALVQPAAASAPNPAPKSGGRFLRNGDLLTVSGRADSLLRLRLRAKKVRTTKVDLGTRMKPKGVTTSAFCEKIAIANSTNVVIFDTWTHEITVVEDERFGLIADVEYDMQCNLIIADMGRHSVGRWPRDGHLWKRDVDGEVWEIGLRNNWVNPAFLDMDEWGTLYVLDKESGPKMPRAGEWYFDAIYKMGAPAYQFAKAKYDRAGLNASAFAVHPDGRMFVGNQNDLVVIDAGYASSPCPAGSFSRINGLDFDQNLRLFAVDGFDIYGETQVLQLVDGCGIERVITGSMLDGAQGLAVGLPAR